MSLIYKYYMQISSKGINLIKKFEGCKLKTYLCSAGEYTIGYGNRYYKDGTHVKNNDEITQKDADDLLEYVLQGFERFINRQASININQNQFDALVCLCYNVGQGNLRKYSLINIINKDCNNFVEIKPYWLGINKIYNKDKNKYIECDGLTKRRQEEFNLYMLPI